LEAVTTVLNEPAAAGVPARVAVPSPLSVKVRPAGSVPVRLNEGFGVPVASTVKEPGAPLWKVAMVGLVNAGTVPALTSSVNNCWTLP
jgi:hypothetical protein